MASRDRGQGVFDLRNTLDVEKVLELIENGTLSEIELDDSSSDLIKEHEPNQPNEDAIIGGDHEEVDAAEEPQIEDCDASTTLMAATEPETGPSPTSGTSIRASKLNIKWRRRSFIEQYSSEFNTEHSSDDVTELRAPIFYFQKYIKDSDIDNMATKTNIYALQAGKTKFSPTTPAEIKTLIALHIPYLRAYYAHNFSKKLHSKSGVRVLREAFKFWLR